MDFIRWIYSAEGEDCPIGWTLKFIKRRIERCGTLAFVKCILYRLTGECKTFTEPTLPDCRKNWLIGEENYALPPCQCTDLHLRCRHCQIGQTTLCCIIHRIHTIKSVFIFMGELPWIRKLVQVKRRYHHILLLILSIVFFTFSICKPYFTNSSFKIIWNLIILTKFKM